MLVAAGAAVLVGGGVVVNRTVLVPRRQAGVITTIVPQPYRLTGEQLTLSSLVVNHLNRALELEYTGDNGVLSYQLSEGQVLHPNALTGPCAPQISAFPERVFSCLAVPTPTTGPAMWRSGPDQEVSQVVVVRGDVIVMINPAEPVTTDAQALALAARLEPADPADLAREAQHSYVP